MITIMLDEILDALRDTAGSEIPLNSDAVLFSRGDTVRTLYVLLAGKIKLSRSLDDGSELVLHRAVGPCTIAEASLYAASYHCDAIALSPCQLRMVSKNDFFSLIKANPSLAFAWSAHLAQMLQSARQASEIMRMKKVCDRVDAWLSWHDGRLPAKGQWKEIAAQIGVSPEALYRELAARKP